MDSGSFHDKMDIQVFSPSFDEFKQFTEFIQHIEAKGAHHAGVAKIIPPQEWTHLRNSRLSLGQYISGPLMQSREEIEEGVFLQTCKKQSKVTVMQYKQLAELSECKRNLSDSNLENDFWINLKKSNALYGADVLGTLFRKNETVWNFNNLPSILLNRDAIKREEVDYAGVIRPYLYYGMRKTSFAFHKEDMDLYSINIHHKGAPKFWYSIPPQHARKFENVVERLYGGLKGDCQSFIRHKQVLIAPWVLEKNGVKINKIVQHQGEIIITFPLGYHAGFNSGFNCNEAVNFATPRWLDYAKRTDWCSCRRRVLFPVDGFIKYYQPEKYEQYINGLDTSPHPEFPEVTSPCVPITEDFVKKYNKFWNEALRMR